MKHVLRGFLLGAVIVAILPFLAGLHVPFTSTAVAEAKGGGGGNGGGNGGGHGGGHSGGDDGGGKGGSGSGKGSGRGGDKGGQVDGRGHGASDASKSYACTACASGKRWLISGATSSLPAAIMSSTASKLRCSVQRTKPTG